MPIAHALSRDLLTDDPSVARRGGITDAFSDGASVARVYLRRELSCFILGCLSTLDLDRDPDRKTL